MDGFHRNLGIPVFGTFCRFGFVEFESPDAAKEACNSMQGQSIDGRQVNLDFSAPRGEGGGRGEFSKCYE